MKRILMAGVIALAAGAQALAADLPPPMAPPPRAPAAYIPAPPPWSWTGFYLGVNGGYGFGNSTWAFPIATTGSFKVNGGMAGATLGYNYQIGQLVLGIEGDYDWQNIRGFANGSGTGFPTATGGCISCDTASGWIGTVRGRVGYAFDRIMVYGTAGGAVTDIKASFAAMPWSSTTEWGWTAGAGIEGAITDNLTAKIEYLYADFQKATCPLASCSPGGVASPTVSLNESMVRVGLNYKFGGF
jgi:outer membrane immunogenic protein